MKYEYKILHYPNGINTETLTKDFNELGKDGWKLVSVEHLHYFFIRENKS